MYHRKTNIGLEFKKIPALVSAATLVLVLVLQLAVALPVSAAGEVFTGGSNVSGINGIPTTISDLQVSGTGNDTISMSLFVPANRTLEMTTTTGLTFTSNTSGNSLRFSGTRSNVNDALATLQFTSGYNGPVTLEASLLPEGVIYYPENDHIYQVISGACDGSVGAGCINWVGAAAAASASTYQGMTGYLATVTSEAENNYISARLTGGEAWIGASDSASEGDWKWVSGPETGTSFYSGLGGQGGAAVGSEYNNWNQNEPNDQAGEDCGEMYAGNFNGKWNDLHCTDSLLGSYIIEYGDVNSAPTVETKNITITTSFPAGSSLSISSCEDLLAIDDNTNNQWNNYSLTQDIDCSHIENFTPIGNDPDYGGGTFKGSFNGQNHTISGLNIDAGSSQAGLFSMTEFAILSNLKLSSGTITTAGRAGSLIGYAEDTLVSNVSSDFTVNGDDAAGGIIGYAQSTDDQNAEPNINFNGLSFTGSVSSDGQVGGIVGMYIVYAGRTLEISESFTDAVIQTTGSFAGGLVGYAYVAATSSDAQANAEFGVSDSYSRGSVSADVDYTGGLIGFAQVMNNTYDNQVSVTVERSYSSATVVGGGDGAGGIIGSNSFLSNSGETVSIIHSFAAGSVTAASRGYALIGGEQNINDGDLILIGNYIDETATGHEDDVQTLTTSTISVNTDGTDADYFKNNTTNLPLSGWDFSAIWLKHLNEFPTLLHSSDLSDLNGDDILDSDQPNIGGYVSPITGKFIAMDMGEGCELTQDDYTQESDLPVQDPGYYYANGLFDFVADCGITGHTTTIKLYYYDVSKANMVVRKFNPHTNAYFNLTGQFGATLEEINIDGHTVTVATYQITDGGILDMEAGPGEIADPAGIASTLGADTVGVPNTGFSR